MVELPENTLDNHNVGKSTRSNGYCQVGSCFFRSSKNSQQEKWERLDINSFQVLKNHIVTANNYSYTMFFFFVGGVEPTVKQTIQTSVAPCPNCHDGSMDLVEMCKTFKAFFIPIWSFGDSRQVLRCNRCKCIMAPSFGGIANRQVMANGNNNGTTVCSCCGGPMQPGWHFCPTCGVDTCTKWDSVAFAVPADRE